MSKFFKSDNWRTHAPDYVIVICSFLLVIIGLAMLTSASSDRGQLRFGDSYFYLKHQLLYGLSLGIILFFLASNIYYRHLQTFATPLLILNFLFLILVFTPLGLSSGGATRWLQLGPVSFQPSELLKITFIAYLASWLSTRSNREHDFWSGYVPFLGIIGITASLLIFQPSTSIAFILIMTALVMYFSSGAKISYIFSTLILGAFAFILLSYLTPYRWQRLMTYFNPEENTRTSSYQVTQARNAIGSGGLWGVGYGQSTTKLRSLPQPIDDSIFAVIAEEMGFIGSSFIILLFALVALRSFILAKRAPDKFGQLLFIGFGALITIQSFMHIGAISGLIPLTGVPLPFVSYGGTALAIFMGISGIMVNISKYS